MNQIDFLLRLNEEFDAIPKDQLSAAARSARMRGNLKMAISEGETTATRFLSASWWWIEAAKLAGVDVDRIRIDFEVKKGNNDESRDNAGRMG